MSLAKTYAKEIHRHLLDYAAVSLEKPLRLGDFGTLDGLLFDGHVFSYEGSMRDACGFQVKERSGTALGMRHYMSKGSVDVKVGAAAKILDGPAPLTQADVELTFRHESSMYVRFRGCRTYLIENMADLTRAVVSLDDSDKWSDDYYVVSEITVAEDATILIAGENGAGVTLQASGPGELIDLADGKVSLSAKQQSKMATHLVGEKGLTPLFRLKALRRTLFRERSRLESKSAAPSSHGELDGELFWVP